MKLKRFMPLRQTFKNKNLAFEQAKSPVPPYTFILEYYDDEIEVDDAADEKDVDEEIFMNKLTNEEFSLRMTEDEEESNTLITIERAEKKKKS